MPSVNKLRKIFSINIPNNSEPFPANVSGQFPSNTVSSVSVSEAVETLFSTESELFNFRSLNVFFELFFSCWESGIFLNSHANVLLEVSSRYDQMFFVWNLCFDGKPLLFKVIRLNQQGKVHNLPIGIKSSYRKITAGQIQRFVAVYCLNLSGLLPVLGLQTSCVFSALIRELPFQLLTVTMGLSYADNNCFFQIRTIKYRKN